MKNRLFIFSLLLTFLSACSQQSLNADTKDVWVEEFKLLIEKHDGVILDVRTPVEVASGRIAESINMNYHADFASKVAQLDKTKPVYVYCASGGRSGRAAHDLNKMGFTTVYNLLGGFGAWRAAKFPEE